MMKKILFLLALLFPVVLGAQTAAYNGYCVQGGVSAVTSGQNSTNKLQGIIPYCNITVYLTGTLTKATIYKDSVNTPQTNPYQAPVNGKILFYAGTGTGYDVVLSGGIPPNTYTTPVTMTDVLVGGGSGGGVTQIVAGTNVTISPPGGTGIVTVNSTGGGGGSCPTNGLYGDMLIDNGDGSCGPSGGYFNGTDSTLYPVYPGAILPGTTSFGTARVLPVPIFGDPGYPTSSSCDGTTCTIFIPNDLNLRTSRTVVFGYGFYDPSPDGSVTSCLNMSGGVTVLLVSPSQFTIQESDTSCVGAITGGDVGNITYDFSGFTVESGPHPIKIEAGYYEFERHIGLAPVSLFGNSVKMETNDVDDNYSHIWADTTPMTDDLSQDTAGNIGEVQTGGGTVLLRAQENLDAEHFESSLTLAPESPSIFNGPRGVTIEGAPPAYDPLVPQPGNAQIGPIVLSANVIEITAPYGLTANGSPICTGATGCGDLSGMTPGQIPIAATASTVTSSIALQGTDTKVLTAGTMSGTASTLCTDANGGATTSGCPDIYTSETDYNAIVGPSTWHGGTFNAGMGYGVFAHITTGIDNVAVGAAAEGSLTIGGGNTAIGYGAAYNNANASHTTAVGFDALTSSTVGDNVALGSAAGFSSTTGQSNIYLGEYAGYHQTTASRQLIIDMFDRGSASAELTSALIVGTFDPTATWMQSVQVNGWLTALDLMVSDPKTYAVIGTTAFGSNTTGHNIAGLGYGVLETNTTGYDDVAIGTLALTSNVSGGGSVAVGNQACMSIISTYYCTAVGDAALHYTTGGDNTALGAYAGASLTTGHDDLYLGWHAGFFRTTEAGEFILDNADRGTEAAEPTSALLFGTFNATPSLQTLTTNGTFTATQGYVGPSTAPSGSCTVTGAWIFSQDGHATFCNGSTWVSKI